MSYISSHSQGMICHPDHQDVIVCVCVCLSFSPRGLHRLIYSGHMKPLPSLFMLLGWNCDEKKFLLTNSKWRCHMRWDEVVCWIINYDVFMYLVWFPSQTLSNFPCGWKINVGKTFSLRCRMLNAALNKQPANALLISFENAGSWVHFWLIMIYLWN